MPNARGTIWTDAFAGAQIVEPRAADLDQILDESVVAADENRVLLAGGLADLVGRPARSGA